MNNRIRYLAPWGRAAAAARALAPPCGGGKAAAEVLAALEGKPALYHCISRVVDHTFRLGAEDKERFVAILRAYEEFSRVRVLTYCVMSNHFHVLVEVPERPEREPGDGELLGWLGALYSRRQVAEVRQRLEHFRAQGNHGAAGALRGRYLRRMWDLSMFMKGVKQRFARWYNGRHKRTGCLWDERFKSVLVEEGHAARVVAGYIDLNPVRAGMVGKPEDYRWSGWGEAAAGNRQAREGLRQVMLERELGRSNPSRAVRQVEDWHEVLAEYRGLMAADEGERRGRHGAGTAGVPGEARGRGGARGGRLSEAEMLRRRVRYFVDGLVVGSEGFVEGVFALTRERFTPGRTSGARRIARMQTPLRSMRALQDACAKTRIGA